MDANRYPFVFWPILCTVSIAVFFDTSHSINVFCSSEESTFFFFLFLFFNPWQSKQYCDTKKFFVCNFVYPVRNYLEKKWNCNVLQLLGCGTLFLFSLFGKRSFSDFHHLCCLWSGDPNREEDASDNLLPNCGTWNMRMIRTVNFVTE